ncbi:MAG: hypothetical protein U9O41_09720, partial [Candidatus Aerophobetes bacterium]|nr:hypothetical protein [Candidatus Aerophobetes bacterium]
MEKIPNYLKKHSDKEVSNLRQEIYEWLDKNKSALDKKYKDFLTRISLEIWITFRIRKLFDKRIITRKKTKKLIFEFLQDENIKKIIEELNKAAKLSGPQKPLFPDFSIAKMDRTTSKELLPLFLTKGIFSNFNKIPYIQDLANEKAKKIGRKLTAKERRGLEVKMKEYKKGGYVWKEFPDYAIGFGYEQFTEYLEKIENEYQEKKREAEAKPFLFPNMQREIEQVLRKVRLYKKGQSLAYGILGEAYLQKKWFETELSKEKAVYYIGKTPDQKVAYSQVKEILNSLRWLSYKVVGRGKSKLKGAVGNFIFNIQEKGDKYLLDINPRYIGCIQYFAKGEKELRTKKERKELFNTGYFNFPMKALVISGDYSKATEEFRNYILRETGNSHLNTKKYKVISQKIKVYVNRAYLTHSRKQRNYQAFVEKVLPTLIRDKFISKLEPSLNKLKGLSPKRAYESNLKLYIPRIGELDKNLGKIFRE